MKTSKIILVVILCLIASIIMRVLFVIGLVLLSFLGKYDTVEGIDNYSKYIYLNEYGGDLDSELSIFPEDSSNMQNAFFTSSLKTSLLDTDGYIILRAKYNDEMFENEIERLSDINITIYESCSSDSNYYTNNIKYDNSSYNYPAYITIDGFSHTYEYALIDRENKEIIYMYLSYPGENVSKYKEYLKRDESEYSKKDTLELFSIYNHSFDSGKSYMESMDCAE